jgi:hypothetical protein
MAGLRPRAAQIPSGRSMNLWRILGIACQAILLGSLLFLAVAKLIAMSSGARVFQYEGF